MEKLEISPLLLQKGSTKIALYGIGEFISSLMTSMSFSLSPITLAVLGISPEFDVWVDLPPSETMDDKRVVLGGWMGQSESFSLFSKLTQPPAATGTLSTGRITSGEWMMLAVRFNPTKLQYCVNVLGFCEQNYI